MHKDSIQDLHEYQQGLYIVQGDTIDIWEFMNEKDIYAGNEEPFKTYLLYRPAMMEKGMLATLTFCKDRLVQINMYTNKTYYVSNFKIQMNWHCKHSTSGSLSMEKDSTFNKSDYGTRAFKHSESGHGNKMVYDYYENLVIGNGYLMIADKTFNKKTPSFCLNCNDSRTWPKLYRYVEKQSAKIDKQYKRWGHYYM